ncbi:MAG: hypothetical protein KGH98_01315 [Candidatus Micrarchaeota archaeon]|nr:hypothetical protein [Candidatus Micrarchaeota archaeon]
MNGLRHFSYFLLLAILAGSIALVADAQIGEVAGTPHFNVSLGSTQTLNYTILSAANYPIGFNVSQIHINHINNKTDPVVSVSPMRGIIQPHTPVQLNVTVYMPTTNNTPGDVWHGYVSVVATSVNSTGGSLGGASVQAGTLKQLYIAASPAKTNWLMIGGAVVAVIIVIVAVLHFKGILKFGGKPSRPSARKAARAPARKGAKRAPKRASKRQPARRKAARKPASRQRRRRR